MNKLNRLSYFLSQVSHKRGLLHEVCSFVQQPPR